MITVEELKELSAQEKIAIIEMIWDSFDESDLENLPLTPEQKEELDRRMDAYAHGESKTYSWEEVKAFVKTK